MVSCENYDNMTADAVFDAPSETNIVFKLSAKRTVHTLRCNHGACIELLAYAQGASMLRGKRIYMQ